MHEEHDFTYQPNEGGYRCLDCGFFGFDRREAEHHQAVKGLKEDFLLQLVEDPGRISFYLRGGSIIDSDGVTHFVATNLPNDPKHVVSAIHAMLLTLFCPECKTNRANGNSLCADCKLKSESCVGCGEKFDGKTMLCIRCTEIISLTTKTWQSDLKSGGDKI